MKSNLRHNTNILSSHIWQFHKILYCTKQILFMSPNTSSFINNLQKSKLVAECPNCQGEFQLSKTILFDGTKPFPLKAEKKKS